MDNSIRKLMMMHKTLHPFDNIDRVDVLRKEGGDDSPALKIV